MLFTLVCASLCKLDEAFRAHDPERVEDRRFLLLQNTHAHTHTPRRIIRSYLQRQAVLRSVGAIRLLQGAWRERRGKRAAAVCVISRLHKHARRRRERREAAERKKAAEVRPCNATYIVDGMFSGS